MVLVSVLMPIRRASSIRNNSDAQNRRTKDFSSGKRAETSLGAFDLSIYRAFILPRIARISIANKSRVFGRWRHNKANRIHNPIRRGAAS